MQIHLGSPALLYVCKAARRCANTPGPAPKAAFDATPFFPTRLLALMRVLARVHERCGEEVEEHVASTAEGRQTLWEAMLTVAVCGDVLVDLVGDDVEDAMSAYRRERDADGAEEAS